MACCGQQASKTFKIGSDALFTCLGQSEEHLLEAGHLYPTGSPVVAGATPQDPWRPMTAVTDVICAFIGPYCGTNATDWTEPKWIHVYPQAVGILQRICWPTDEEGASIFTVEQIETIAHSHKCCIHFDKELPCQEAPAWLVGQETTTIS